MAWRHVNFRAHQCVTCSLEFPFISGSLNYWDVRNEGTISNKRRITETREIKQEKSQKKYEKKHNESHNKMVM